MEMPEGQLPSEGPLRIGPVTLPPGKPITGRYGKDHHVGWATVDPVPEPGRVWAALSDLHPQTGLVPVLLDGLSVGTMFPDDRQGLPDDALRPWDNGEFCRPEDPREADRLNAGALLEELWRSASDVDDPEAMAQWAPFSRGWPGLAAPESMPLTTGERHHALDVVLPRILRANGSTWAARIALIPASRPADVLPVIGWSGMANHEESTLRLTAVLRSWEDRFGAQLISIGYADLRLLVDRPPHTLEAAQRIAAEQVFLADDCIDGARGIPEIAPRLLNGPVWTFWWD
jgi:hypothetical protein